jgi:hypothetical protein
MCNSVHYNLLYANSILHCPPIKTEIVERKISQEKNMSTTAELKKRVAELEALLDLGIDWNSVETLNNLQTGLITALNNMGYQLTRRA